MFFEKIKNVCSPTINKIIFLSFLGVLFSGYLSAVKLFSKTCAIDTGCSYFLGYPTCYFGFAGFVLILISALANKYCNWGGKTMKTARLHFLRTISFAGLAFSLYFSGVEIAKMINEKITYGALILPTCFYGMILFAIVFVLSFKFNPER